MRAAWMIGLLDTFRLERDGMVVSRFYDRAQDRLLAYLALRPGTALDRDLAARALWPDRPVALAYNRLAVTLHLLKKQLGEYGLSEDAITANRHVLQWHPAISTDVQRFEACVAAALRTQGWEEQMRLLEEAFDLYGAGLLPLLSGPWMQPERERLEVTRARAVRRLADILTQHDANAQALPFDENVSPEDLVRYHLLGRSLSSLPPPPLIHEGAAPARDPTRRRGDQEDMGSLLLDVAREVGKDFPRHHAERCLALAEEAEPHLFGPDRGVWLDRLDKEYEGIKQALAWAIEHGEAEIGIALAGAMGRYWWARSRLDEGRRYLEQVLSLAPLAHAAPTARALQSAGALALQAGDLDLSRRRLQQAMLLWQELGNQEGVARTLNNLGIVAYRAGDYTAARRAYEESLGLIRSLGRPEILSPMLKDAALLHITEGDYAQAEALLQERLGISRDLDDSTAVASTLTNLGTVAQFQSDPARARVYVEEGLRLSEEAGDLKGVAYALRLLGHITQQEGDLSAARALYQGSKSVSGSLQDMRGVGESLRYLGEVNQELGDLDQARASIEQSIQLLESANDAAGAAKSKEALAKLVI